MHFPRRILDFFVSDSFFHLHKIKVFWQLEHGLFWQFYGSSTQRQDGFLSRRGRSFLPKKVLFSFLFVRQMNCRVHIFALKAPTFIAQFTSTHIHMHNCNKDLSISEAFSLHPAWHYFQAKEIYSIDMYSFERDVTKHRPMSAMLCNLNANLL